MVVLVLVAYLLPPVGHLVDIATDRVRGCYGEEREWTINSDPKGF